MNYSSFCDYLFAALMRQLESGTTITKEMIRKNNHVLLEAFIIRLPGVTNAPVVYLETLYENYKQGSSIDKIAAMILARLEVEIPLTKELANGIHSLDYVRDKIVFRLISRKENEELLEDVPWIPFLDLAVIFFLHLGTVTEKQITAVIHNRMAGAWNLSTKELYELAKTNTPRIYPSTLCLLEHLVLGWNEHKKRLRSRDLLVPDLFVLSNHSGIYGATCILYENIIKDFADNLGSDLIILPSSIHEVLILSDTHTEEYDMYRDMVRNINAEEVDPEDQLSDEIYLYRRDSSEIILWMPCDSGNADTCGTESL